jgi:hypothetical protein
MSEMTSMDHSMGEKSAFVADVKQLIRLARQRSAVAVNAELTMLYWQVGRRISVELLKGERAEYGKQIVESLSGELTETFGRGWEKRSFIIDYALRRLFPTKRLSPHCVDN